MYRFLQLLLALSLTGAPLVGVQAQSSAKDQMKGLDEQVQDIKKDVLAISTELLQLEEKLLYPSNTQVSVFVSLAPGSKLQIDSMAIKLNGAAVAHHIYTYKELEALRSGGIQRIHTGNVRSGEHAIEVALIGKTGAETTFKPVATYKFKKQVEPKLLEIVVGASLDPGQAIQFRE